MKKLLLITLTLICTYSFSQRDKKATEILDSVINNTNSYNNFKVDFTYSMKNEDAGIDESKDGSITVEGDKYRLNLANQIVICDGTTVWTYLLDDQEVMINSVEESDESITPTNLLNKYNEKYKSKFVGEEKDNGNILEIIELKPEEGKTYSKIEISIDKNKKLIHNFIIYDNSGSTYAYQINQFKPDVEISDTLFNFNESKHSDVDIIDMRY